jgi:hypothetical protein
VRYAPLAVKRLVAAVCVLPATRRSPREGSGCQGGDPWLRHGEGACARALTQERAQRTLRRLPAGRTAAARCRPGERPPSLPAPDASPAMGSLPLRPAPRSTEPDKRPMPASREERTPPTVDRKQGDRSMRVLCDAPKSPASMSPAVGVADGISYPLGGVEVWQRRSVQLIAFAAPGGIGSNIYLRFPSVP